MKGERLAAWEASQMLGASDESVRHATLGAIFRLWVQWPPHDPGFHDVGFGGNACNGGTKGENVVNQLEVKRRTGVVPTCPMCLALWNEALAQQVLRVPDAPEFGVVRWTPTPGRQYRNVKTQNLYEVTELTRCSETLELRVSYKPAEADTPAWWGWDGTPWSRPIALFVEKFTEHPGGQHAQDEEADEE